MTGIGDEEAAASVRLSVATIDDAGELLTLQRAAYTTEARLYGDPELPALTQTLAELRDELRAVTAIKATAGTRMVGAVRVRVEGATAHIGRLVVAPDWQGRGVGGRLLAAAEAHPGAAVRTAALFTGHLSSANLAMYTRRGYVERRREELQPGVELVHLTKPLRPVREPLRIAVAQPPCVAMDPAANAVTHADVVRRAGARVVVFPELSLTGYELAAPAVAPDDPLWAPLVQACGATGTLALVGAPVAEGGREYIAVLAVSGDGVEVAYRKAHPGAAESVRFSAGPGPVALGVDGWRIGLGVCRDTGIATFVDGVAALGVDVVAAGLVDSPADLAEQRRRAGHLARTCGAHVAFASFAGPTGAGYVETAGGSAVYAPDGSILVACEAADVVGVELPSGLS